MKIYYPTREIARSNKGSGKVVDCANSRSSGKGYRWAVELRK